MSDSKDFSTTSTLSTEGLELLSLLLEEEGIEFVKDKVDFKKYGWKGPDEADEPKQETLF